jgi:hypothetical protein
MIGYCDGRIIASRMRAHNHVYHCILISVRSMSVIGEVKRNKSGDGAGVSISRPHVMLRLNPNQQYCTPSPTSHSINTYLPYFPRACGDGAMADRTSEKSSGTL